MAKREPASVKIRRQPPYKGGRIPASSAFLPSIEEAIRGDMKRFSVSRSFVIATACAFAFNIDEQADYRAPERRRRT